MADVVRLPRQLHRVRPGHVDHGRVFDQRVRGLETGVALADHEHPLVGERLGVRVEGVVPLDVVDAGDLRHVQLRDPGGHHQAPRLPRPSTVVGDDEPARVARDLGDIDVVVHLETGREVLEVPDDVVGVREVPGAVAGEQQVRVVGQQRVPVHPHPLLRVVEAGVDLVDGDQLAMPGIAGEERAGPAAAFEDGVVATVPLQQCGELQTGRSRADDQVVVRHVLGSYARDLRTF